MWFTDSDGKQHRITALFNRAVQGPIANLYERFPGTLNRVKRHKLVKIIGWQVRKDRNNWKGKTPRRQLFPKDVTDDFDWQMEARSVEELERRRFLKPNVKLSADFSRSNSGASSSSEGSFTSAGVCCVCVYLLCVCLTDVHTHSRTAFGDAKPTRTTIIRDYCASMFPLWYDRIRQSN